MICILLITDIYSMDPQKLLNDINTNIEYAILNDDLQLFKENFYSTQKRINLTKDISMFTCNALTQAFSKFMHSALDHGANAIALHLLKCQYKDIISIKTCLGGNALHLAAKACNTQVLEELLKYKYQDQLNAKGECPLHRAAFYGNLETVKCFCEKTSYTDFSCAWNKQNTLHFAAMNGHLNIVKYLILIKKMNVNSIDNRKKTSLYYAAKNLHDKVVLFLLQNGADSSRTDYCNKTALDGVKNISKKTLAKKENKEKYDCIIEALNNATESNKRKREPTNNKQRTKQHKGESF